MVRWGYGGHGHDIYSVMVRWGYGGHGHDIYSVMVRWGYGGHGIYILLWRDGDMVDVGYIFCYGKMGIQWTSG